MYASVATEAAGDALGMNDWPDLSSSDASTLSCQKQSEASSASTLIDWSFGVSNKHEQGGRRDIRFLPPEPGEKLILDPEQPTANRNNNVWGGDLGTAAGARVSGGAGGGGKVKVKSFGYQRTESSIHGSMAHGNVKKVNGQLVNDFTPTLQQAMTEKPGQTLSPHLVKQFQTGVKMPVSALTEWGSQSKNKIEFREVAVMKENNRKGSFACVAITQGFQHQQGVGRTKKEAKHRAACIAFCNVHKIPYPLDEDPANYKLGSSGGRDGAVHPSKLINNSGSQIFPVNTTQTPPSGVFHNSEQGYVNMEQRLWCQAELQSETTFDERESTVGAASSSVSPHPHRQSLCANGPPPGFEGTLHECVTDADAVYRKFENKVFELKAGVGDKELAERLSSNWAAFLVQREHQLDPYQSEVVAVGAGCAHIRNEPDRDTNGSLLHDSHAVVLARRSFLRFLYKNYEEAVCGNERERQQSILEVDRRAGSVSSASFVAKLKAGVQIHVCMVTSPCGEALQRSCKQDKDRRLTQKDIDTIISGDHIVESNSAGGRVHVKCGRGFETVCATDNVTRQPFESVSCTDKIYKWNVLGVQGTLLSYFMQPIYVTSFNIGSKFIHSHFVSAVCCRGLSNPELKNLREPFFVNCPYVGRTTVSRAREVDFSGDEEKQQVAKVALNWHLGDDKVELTDPLTGMVIDESPVKVTTFKMAYKSRICKSAFWFRFENLLKKLKWVKPGDAERSDHSFATYQGSKKKEVHMSAAKRAFAASINYANRGRWTETELKRGNLFFSR